MSTDNTDRPAPQTPGTPDDVDSASASAATPVTGPVAANAPQGETSVNLTVRPLSTRCRSNGGGPGRGRRHGRIGQFGQFDRIVRIG